MLRQVGRGQQISIDICRRRPSCGQCHVESRGTKLTTDLLFFSPVAASRTSDLGQIISFRGSSRDTWDNQFLVVRNFAKCWPISIILVAAVGKNFTVKQRSKISSHCERTPDWLVNWPRDAMSRYGRCICVSQVAVLSKRLNESSWFLAW